MVPQPNQLASRGDEGRVGVRACRRDGNSLPATEESECWHGLFTEPLQNLARASLHDPGVGFGLFDESSDSRHIHSEFGEALGGYETGMARIHQRVLEFDDVCQKPIGGFVRQDCHTHRTCGFSSVRDDETPAARPLSCEQTLLLKLPQCGLHSLAIYAEFRRQPTHAGHGFPPMSAFQLPAQVGGDLPGGGDQADRMHGPKPTPKRGRASRRNPLD